MNPTVAQYIGFVVIALILIWAVIELNSRISRHRENEREAARSTWVNLDTRRADEEREEARASSADQAESNESLEESDPGLHTRAKQNGHYSESKTSL